MKRFIARAISILLVATMLMSFVVIEASAATYRSAANSASSSYKSSKYYTYFNEIPITGDGRTDVLSVALSQLGYQEGASGVYSGDGNGTGNYTEFNYNMGTISSSYSYAWCATYVSWALYQSQCTNQNTQSAWCRNHTSDSAYIWREVSCSQWASQLERFGYFQKSAAAGGSYIPQSGDLIFYSWSGATSSEDHIGLVVYSDGTNVYTVEGNTSSATGLDDEGGGVYFKSYDLSYKYITGYGVLPYATNNDAKKIDRSGANPTAGLYITNVFKYLYADPECTTVAKDSSGSTVSISRYTTFTATGVTEDKGALIVNYNGVDGYVALNSDKVLQLTNTEPDEVPEDNLASDREYVVAYNNTPYDKDDGKYTALLTDGVASESFSTTDGSWYIFSAYHNAPYWAGYVTIDFDNIVEVNKLRLHLANTTAPLVQAPTSINVYTSLNGIDYTQVGTMPIDSSSDSIYWSNLELDSAVRAGSVRFEFNLANGFAYLNEVEVHGTETSEAYAPTPKITFIANGGEGTIVDQTTNSDGTFTLPENSFTAPEGMRFKAWNVGGVAYDAGETVTLTEDTYISAIWVEIKYRGDINEADGINTYDYLILKRQLLFPDQTKSISEAADINANGTIEVADYILLRRICLGLYSIPESNIYC